MKYIPVSLLFANHWPTTIQHYCSY